MICRVFLAWVCRTFLQFTKLQKIMILYNKLQQKLPKKQNFRE